MGASYAIRAVRKYGADKAVGAMHNAGSFRGGWEKLESESSESKAKDTRISQPVPEEVEKKKRGSVFGNAERTNLFGN